MILFTIYALFIVDMIGMGEKNLKHTITKAKEKINPFGCPPIPPSMKLEADCFPGRKNRKQAGPTLCGTGTLNYGEKEIQGRARYGSIEAGNMIFIHMNFQDLQKKAG